MFAAAGPGERGGRERERERERESLRESLRDCRWTGGGRGDAVPPSHESGESGRGAAAARALRSARQEVGDSTEPRTEGLRRRRLSLRESLRERKRPRESLRGRGKGPGEREAREREKGGIRACTMRRLALAARLLA